MKGPDPTYDTFHPTIRTVTCVSWMSKFRAKTPVKKIIRRFFYGTKKRAGTVRDLTQKIRFRLTWITQTPVKRIRINRTCSKDPIGLDTCGQGSSQAQSDESYVPMSVCGHPSWAPELGTMMCTNAHAHEGMGQGVWLGTYQGSTPWCRWVMYQRTHTTGLGRRAPACTCPGPHPCQASPG